MSQKTIQIAGVGAVVVEHSPRAKYISLSVRPFRGVRVAVPLRATLKQGEIVARARVAWLAKHVAKAAEIERQAAQYRALNHLAPGAAHQAILLRVAALAQAHGFSYGRVTIRKQRTRWGSCSSKNNLSLNINIAQLPTHLMDYVILHELVHTRIRNHSQAFWQELGKVMSDPKRIDRTLNRYGFLLAL